MPKVVEIAGREKRRLVNAAVGRNFFKTITEPVTNSDSILKKHAGVPSASGLIAECLKLQPGDVLNTAEIKGRIPKTKAKKICIEIFSTGKKARICRIVDAGSGMGRDEIETKFVKYAAAKAKGENTRSLFGRGLSDVLFYHDDAKMFSVAAGVLSRCDFYWKNGDMEIDAKSSGSATKKLLLSYDLPQEILHHGTVVEFRLKEGTHIPVEEQIISKISSFYMLRLIAADPNTEVEIIRKRADGTHIDTLKYDFPLGIVVARNDDELDLKDLGKLPVNIVVARSDVALESDAVNIERRENGLLFVDENDAVLDLTLLPEFDKNPYLKHLYGIVRIVGLRSVLEAKLEGEEAEAVLTTTRDGFDVKSEITRQIFALVERHVKPIYEAEEKSQKKGSAARSEKLGQRLTEALKAINQFNADETDEEGDESGPKPLSKDAIFFSVEDVRLYVGVTRRVSVFVNLEKVPDGEVVLFEGDRTEFKLEPDSGTVKGRKNQTHQRFSLFVTCAVKNLKGYITALTLDKSGKEVSAKLRILGVDDQPVFVPPDDIAFSAFRYSGDPNRHNNATLLVNLKAFHKLPEITFKLEDVVGNVVLPGEKIKLSVQVEEGHRVAGQDLARVVVSFSATGWGHQAKLVAQAKRSDGKLVTAKCSVKFEHPEGGHKFSDFVYEDLGRPVLGDVAGNKIYVNSGYALHKKIFGADEEQFNKNLETNPMAQARAASIFVETAVFHTATTKHQAGGKKGLHINPDDPMGSLRPYLDESKMKLEPKVYQALVSVPDSVA
jgi:hypothetical protein